MENFDDITLMREIQDGNRNAFSVLVNRHAKYFYAIAYRFVNNRETAEDIMQTAFLKLWEKPYKFDCDGSAGFKTWFARCVINLCHDNHRSYRPVKSLDDTQIADARMNAAEITEKQHRFVALNNAIKKLSTTQQTAITLGVIQDMKYGDVAEIMKKSVGAVKVLVNRAKAQLEISMKEQGYGME